MNTQSMVKFEFKKLEELVPADSICMLLYGASGTMKTPFCGTMGERGLLINVGQGIESLLSPEFKKKVGKGPRIITVDEEVDPATGIFKEAKAFDKVCEIIEYALTLDDIDSIALDDATFFSMYANNRALEANEQLKKSQTLAAIRKVGLPIMAVQDFGMQMAAIQWFLSTYIPMFKSRKKNFILTAHERNTFEKGSNIGDMPTLRKVGPGFVGQTFPDTIPAFFDMVWHSEVQGSGPTLKYRFRTVQSPIIVAKTRWGGVFKEFEGLEESAPLNFQRISKTLKDALKNV